MPLWESVLCVSVCVCRGGGGGLTLMKDKVIYIIDQGPLLLKWFNFNSSMDK